ncbi:MAG: AmmeMemoRadiSam system protein B [Bacillota bacterium]
MKKLLFLSIACMIVLAVAAFTGSSEDRINNRDRAGFVVGNHHFHPNIFFEPQWFGGKDAGNPGEGVPGIIGGAVVPHHLLAHELMGQVFAELAHQEPSLVIIVGPNHFNKGARILTSLWAWETPFGMVEVDNQIADEVLKLSLVQRNDQVFSTEHSMGNLMPFVKYYLPEAKVLPIILHYDVTWQEAKALGEHLAALAEKERAGAVIIASVDFSHYLTRKEAEAKDAETITALKAKNMGRIFAMGNDYLDSPASIGVIFAAMDRMGCKEFEILANTNSGIILGNDLIETTSYITMLFYHQNKI